MPVLTNSSGRTKKSAVNFVTGFLLQLVILVLNFVVRYIFIYNIGYEYLGVNSLFTSILTILSVADLGFGSALGIVLYSSLANKNEEEIAGLMNFFKKVYLVIGIIVTFVGLAIAPIIKYFVNTDADIPHLSLFFLIFLLNTVSSYFVSYRAILIRADQKNSVVNNVTTIVKITKALFETAVLFLFPKFFDITVTYIAYLVVMVLSTYAIGIITSIYAKKKYPYAFKRATVDEQKKDEIISTTKDLFVYRLCNAFSSPIDAVLISLFIGTTVLGVYSNYLLIFTTLMEFICLISRNVISSVGNFVVTKPLKEQRKLYFEMQMIYFAIIIFCSINFVSLATPFISLIFKPENALSLWIVFLFGATLIFKSAGELAIIFRETTKIYKKTKYISLIYTIVHIALSIVLGYFMGIEGVMLGNVIAYFLTNFWFEIYALFKWYFKENPAKIFLQFLYVIAIASVGCIGGFFLCKYLYAKGNIYFVACCGASLLISLLLLISLYPLPGFKSLVDRTVRIVSNIWKKISPFYNNRIIQTIIPILYFVSLTGLIVSRDIFGININKFIFFGLLVICVLLCKKSTALFLILFTLPFSPSLAELYILIFSMGYIFLISFKNRKIRDWLVIFGIPLLFFGLEILLSSIYGDVSLSLALRIFVLLSILGMIYYDKNDFTKKHLYAFVLGCLFMFVMIAIAWWVPAIYGIHHINPKYSWLNIEIMLKNCRLGFSTANWIITYAGVDYPIHPTTMIGEDPNNIGLIALTCIATLYALFGTAKRGEKVLIVVLQAVFFVFGIWCQSRMFILSFVLFYFVALIVALLTRRLKIVDGIILLASTTLLVSLFILKFPDTFNKIISRFGDKDVSTGGGRITLIVDYSKFLFSDWKYALFGVGVNNLPQYSGISIPPHMNIVQFACAYGLIVFTLFVAFFIFTLVKTKEKFSLKSGKVYLLMPVIFTFVFSLSLQLFIPSIILITFIPGVISLSFLNKNSDKKFMYRLVEPAPVEKDRKIRIAICSTSFGGGIGSYIANIARSLSKDNFEITLIYNFDTTKEEIKRFKKDGANQISYSGKIKRFKPIKLNQKYSYFLNTFEQIKPDIIYINASSHIRSFIVLQAAKNYKAARVVTHCHNAVNEKTKLPLNEKIFRAIGGVSKFNHYACSSEAGKVFYGKSFMSKKRKHKEAIINNYIDIERFKFDSLKREAIRNKFNIKKTDILLGDVGRLCEDKNQSFLIDIVSQLPKKYKALIVGDGPLLDKLTNQIKQKQLDDRIKLVPNTKEIDKYYCAFDFFVHPSFIEGLPFVCVEAQCSGLINLIYLGIPAGTKITNNVIALPLDEQVWATTIANSKPNVLIKRRSAAKSVDEKGFGEATASRIIADSLKEIAYE